MAVIPVFKNISNEELVVPGYNGSGISVPKSKYVRGSYYALSTTPYLEEVADLESVAENLIVYTFPELSTISGSSSGITEIVTTDGLTGGGTTGVITLGIEDLDASLIQDGTITASKIADGELVKSINTLTDAVTLAAGTGITLTPVENTITIATTSAGLASVNPTTPLSLSLSSGNTILNGSIAITAAHSGGAVALQATTPGTVQTGNINITGTIIADRIMGRPVLAAGIFEVGSYQVANYYYAIFSADAADGIISFQLPELTGNYPSGEVFYFVKTDATTNSVAITTTSGQLISGVTQRNLTTQWSVLRVASVTSANVNYWVMV